MLFVCCDQQLCLLFVFISSTMRFSGYGLGASYLATHNHSAVIPEVTLKSNSGSVHFHLSDPHGVSSKKSVKNAIRLVHK
jgi:hypothetical protein